MRPQSDLPECSDWTPMRYLVFLGQSRIPDKCGRCNKKEYSGHIGKNQPLIIKYLHIKMWPPSPKRVQRPHFLLSLTFCSRAAMAVQISFAGLRFAGPVCRPRILEREDECYGNHESVGCENVPGRAPGRLGGIVDEVIDNRLCA